MVERTSEVTRLLLEWRSGNEDALERMLPLVYDELKRLARSYLRRERPGHTLQPTALVHEAYLRLVDSKHKTPESRSHFFGIAARLMRQVLVDQARARKAAKRGGGVSALVLDEAIGVSGQQDLDLLALDDALSDLAKRDPRQSRIVELRFFAGLEVEEIAELMGIGSATVKRDWKMARVWLYGEVRGA